MRIISKHRVKTEIVEIFILVEINKIVFFVLYANSSISSIVVSINCRTNSLLKAAIILDPRPFKKMYGSNYFRYLYGPKRPALVNCSIAIFTKWLRHLYRHKRSALANHLRVISGLKRLRHL